MIWKNMFTSITTGDKVTRKPGKLSIDYCEEHPLLNEPFVTLGEKYNGLPCDDSYDIKEHNGVENSYYVHLKDVVKV